MSDWQSTLRVPARVLFAHGDSLGGELHLQPTTALHQRAETPLEMLNRPDRFFAMTLASGEVALVGKAQTAVVACHGFDPPADPERLSVGKEQRLEVHVVGGRRYEGVARTELPPFHSRALDFLNDDVGFLELTHGDTVHFINRGMVQHVHPVD